MNKEEFINELSKLNIPVDAEKLKKLDIYYHLLLTENNKYNLTNITQEEDVYLKHFYDSLTITKVVELNNQSLCDIGTGAGFPGLVLKIFYPNLKVDLLDATTKKCNFLKLVIEKLSLKEINVINRRAEEYSKETREKYDIVTSRAVAPLKHLLEYSIPLLKINGQFIALKSNINEEIKNIDNYYKKLSLTNSSIKSFNLPKEGSYRTIYSVQKMAKTKDIYPRKYNQIKKSEI